MADAYLLSEKDRQKIAKMLHEYSMSHEDNPQPPKPIALSQDVYIAKVQPVDAEPGIIPALIPKGEDNYDHPSYAICDMYQIISSTSGEDWDLMPMSGSSFPVYNLSTSEVNGNDYFLAVKNKAGCWIALGGGGYDRISGLATAEVTGGNFNIDNVTVIKGKNPLTDPDSISETVAVINTMAWNIDSAGRVFAQWNPTLNNGDGGWQAYQAKCPV
ncbi:MAG: hypothetical protein ABIH76_04470 [Candidatus Bathyarchaeota archaeon]